MTLRVASYNVHGCVGTDRRFDLGRIADVLGELDADILLLQEVGDHVGRGPTVDQARGLAEALGMDHAVGTTMPTGPWGYGNAILVRGRIAASARWDLSVPGREPRGCLRVEAELAAGRRVTVVNVHLGLAWGERRRQVDALLGPGGPIAGEAPTILGGDFNDWPPGPATRLLGTSLLDAAFPAFDFRGTFPARLPLLRLDRLYSSRRLDVRDYRVHRSPLARVASDHLPIVASYDISSVPAAVPAARAA